MIDQIEDASQFAREINGLSDDGALMACAVLLEPAPTLLQCYDLVKNTAFTSVLRGGLDNVYDYFRDQRLTREWPRLSAELSSAASAVMDDLVFSQVPPSWFVEYACTCVAEFSRVSHGVRGRQDAIVCVINALNELMFALVDEDVGRRVLPRDADMGSSRHVLLDKEESCRRDLVHMIAQSRDRVRLIEQCLAAREPVLQCVVRIATRLSKGET